MVEEDVAIGGRQGRRRDEDSKKVRKEEKEKEKDIGEEKQS